MSKTYVYNEKLKYARDLRGWSQEELARRVGCLAESMGHQGVVLDVSTISRWERGRNSPTPFYRQLLCSLFEMNAEELGLLSPDYSPQEDTVTLRGFSSPEITLNEDTIPIAVTYSRDMPTSSGQGSIPHNLGVIDTPLHYVEQSATYQDFHRVETPPSDSAPHSPFMRRRNFLLALLAGTTLAGGITVKLLLSRPDTIARYWPKVTPDIHKKSARVRVIQRMLNAHSEHLEIDGIFWVETENAVMFFQENIHIPVTGTVSSLTWERLILPSSMTDHQQIVYQGSQVKAVQEMLNSYGASPRLQVDGTFGPLTQAATKHFQQTHQLTVTGKADLNTWCVLVGGYLK